jgi:hypothetical protein
MTSSRALLFMFEQRHHIIFIILISMKHEYLENGFLKVTIILRTYKVSPRGHVSQREFYPF